MTRSNGSTPDPRRAKATGTKIATGRTGVQQRVETRATGHKVAIQPRSRT